MKRVHKEKVILVGPKKVQLAVSLIKPFIDKYKVVGFDKLIRMVANEDSLQDIGDEFDVSRERVRQWIQNYNLREALGQKTGMEVRNGVRAEQKVQRGVALFHLYPWEKKILNEAEKNGCKWIPDYVYDNGRIVHRTFCINQHPCVLRNATHRVQPSEDCDTEYARYRVRLLRHPDAKFLVLWVAELKQVAIIPTRRLNGHTNIHFRLTDRKEEWDDWSEYLGAWNLLKEGKHNANSHRRGSRVATPDDSKSAKQTSQAV